MKRILLIVALLLPFVFLQAQRGKDPSSSKSHKKEISASKLPHNVTAYITKNLPNAKITRAVKQKRNPDATYVVNLSIKSKRHTLVFNKAGALVKLNGKALKATVPKK